VRAGGPVPVRGRRYRYPVLGVLAEDPVGHHRGATTGAAGAGEGQRAAGLLRGADRRGGGNGVTRLATPRGRRHRGMNAAPAPGPDSGIAGNGLDGETVPALFHPSRALI